jgi:hypothetical protein
MFHDAVLGLLPSSVPRGDANVNQQDCLLFAKYLPFSQQ